MLYYEALNELAKRYRDMIHDYIDDGDYYDYFSKDLSARNSAIDLLKSVNEFKNGIEDRLSLNKLNRWLGYIQGTLIAWDITTLQKERDFSRPLFNLLDTDYFYFESHITIEPVFSERLELANQIAEKHGFRVADLLMMRDRDSTEKRSNKDTFMSARDNSYKKISEATINLVLDLQKNGFQVWRYKIEDTLIDSRISDDMKLLK